MYHLTAQLLMPHHPTEKDFFDILPPISLRPQVLHRGDQYGDRSRAFTKLSYAIFNACLTDMTISTRALITVYRGEIL